MENNKSSKKVLLGLSGGVDSAVSALLLKKQGYKVIGCFMKCFSDTKDPLTGECSWTKDKKDAQKIAAQLKIPFLQLDLEKQYKSQVIKPMIEGYKKGLTPNPDIACNTIVKFPWLWKYAKKLKCDYIATGHYARIKKTKLGFQLLKGKDKTKDQSYFLSELSQEDLSHTLFPVGNLTKDKIRIIAKQHKLPIWNKLGTRGICFVGKVNIKSFLEKTIKHKQGKVISEEGEVIGTHPGVQYYTIGQRVHPSIGINIHKPKYLSQEKLYIAKKIKPNTLIVAKENSPLLFKNKIFIKNIHLISSKDKILRTIQARIRHLGEMHPGRLIKNNNNYTFIPNKPIKSVAEGQFLVLYNKDTCLGSGEIRLSN
jgi:tRNA-specific 2-thiouridylase